MHLHRPRAKYRTGKEFPHRKFCCPAAQAGSQGLPKDWTRVVSWARQRFREAAAPSPQELRLAPCCLLIALEEEASVEAAHPEMQEVLMLQTTLKVPSRAGAATWSLSRLDALARQVHDLVMSQSLDDVTAPPPVTSAAAQQHPHPQQPSGPILPQALSGSCVAPQEPLALDPAGAYTQPSVPLDELAHEAQGELAGGAGSPDTGAGSLLPEGLFRSQPMRVLDAINTVLFDWQGYGPCNRYGHPRDSHLSSVLEGGLGCSPALSILYMEVASRLGVHLSAVPLEEGRYWLLRPTDPLHTLTMPGTTPDPPTPTQQQDTQPGEQQPGHDRFSAVEAVDGAGTGPGSSQGQVPGAPPPPAGAGMTGGGSVLIDPYGRGGLLAEEEVCELFELTPGELSQPSSSRQLLACLLADLRDAYWCRAVGCPAAPAVRVPLTLTTALQNRVGGLASTHAMDRALAAAEKITWLMPHDSQAQLHLALLHYHARQWDDAWLELGLFLERHRDHQTQQDDDAAQRGAVVKRGAAAGGEGDGSDDPGGGLEGASGDVNSEVQLGRLLLEKIRLRLTLTQTA